MTSVTVSDTQYNITVSDTANTVTVGTGGDVNVTVNTQTISTSVSNTGSGAGVGKAIVSDTLQLRKIKTTGNDLTITEGTDDIDIVLANPISVNVTGTVSSIANHDTDALSEGSSNLYFTDARHDTRARAYLQGVHNADIYPDSSGVRTLGNASKNYAGIYVDNIFADTLQTVDGTGAFVVKNSIEPVSDDTLDLGSTTKRFRDLYLGPGSLFINNQKVLEDDSGEIVISSTNNLNIQSGGALTIDNTGNTTTINDTTISLGPSVGGATVNIRGTLESPDTHVGDLEISSTLLNQTTTDANLEIRTNGNGYTHINTADLYVGPLSGAVKIDENSIGVTAGTLTVTGNLTGSVTGQVSDLSNHILDEDDFSSDSATKVPSQQSTKAYIATQIQTKDNSDEITEGSSNLYFTDARARAAISENSTQLSYNNSTGVLTYTQGNTDTVSEGSSNLYYTNERVDDRVNALLQAGSNITLTYDDASNTLTIAATDTEDNLSNNDTDDLAEGSTNQYFTTARARASISASGSLAYNSSTGALTYTQGNTDTVSEGSSNLYHTTARAIAAVEGESTLDLSGAVTITGQLTASDTIKVDDGFIQTSFNPYGAGANMPTTVAGIGQEDGWAALHIRSRGEHDFGIGSQYNLVPRALMTLSAGRKSGSSDDYLNNNDTFGAVLFNPYSDYRTGTEWLTPSATIYGIATEDHSASGMGTKLEFATTENTNKAGAADLAHTNKSVFLQGTTFTSSDTIKIDDDLQVTGDIGNNGSAVDFDDNIKVTGNISSKTTTIGDFDSSGSPAYAMSGMQIDAGDVAWPTVVFKEYAGTDGGGNKPVNLFTNPGFETEVFGGTPASPAALGDAKRILSVNGNAANGATLPGLANIRILGQTVGTQSGSNRGSEFILQTTPSNETTIRETLKLQGNILQIGDSGYNSGHGVIKANGGDLKLDDRLDTSGNNIINSSGDVTIDDNLKVNTNLTVDGNTVLGNANTDTVTCNGKLNAVNGFVNTILDTATANYLAGVGAIDEGAMAYISDGNAGGKCLAFYDGSNWKKAHAPGDNISSS